VILRERRAMILPQDGEMESSILAAVSRRAS
jgi:hypothetical protein